MKFQFYVKFHTRHGQSLLITGNIAELGNNGPEGALPMVYLNNDFWQGSLEIKRKELPKDFSYRYILKNEDGELLYEWGDDRRTPALNKEINDVQLIDTWNHAGEFENAFYTTPFKEVFLHHDLPKSKKKEEKNITHVFKVKAPLLKKNECLCLLGGGKSLHDWDTTKPIILNKEGNWWMGKTDLSGSGFPVAYKYGIFDAKEKKFITYEGENNRLVFSEAGKKKITVLHDGFAMLPNNTWKGAGIAIPVFSLRSKNSFGVGEFTDIKLLVDWATETGIKLIQLLPVNDTIATNTWMDSYPYAAISAFALHPIYINLSGVAGKKNSPSLKKKQKQLNALPVVDYEEVVKYKISVLKKLYEISGKEVLASDDYQSFLKENSHWLQPYASFCYFRDKFGTTKFTEWLSDKNYNKEKIEKLFSEKSLVAQQTGFYCFIQYHLHLQLKEAADYAHKKGVVLKGDIPIGVYRYGCDAWMAPELYNMHWQAGAPPDDFTAVGQNWGFPTYNWKKMQEDGFSWWKQRFEQMSYYFDAFRIDHILGFFRIWSIPDNAVQGILGRFIPCIPVHINEFGENGIWFDYQRYCRPYITDEVLQDLFGRSAPEIKENFLEKNEFSGYNLCAGFETQLQVEKHFAALENSSENEKQKLGLFELISNVILLEDKQSPGEEFHFRISMEKTLSFKYLIPHVQEKLKTLYVNYFYRRQDDFWFKEAMHKLPNLKAATNMLVCGEDLGMVPHCVPEVMRQLGILSLEIQRMPKDPQKEFFNPDDAPYMSVITPSTHDMSTIRSWWKENHGRTQQFYNTILAQHGDAPETCESWINRAIVLQHLYSPAMWSIFQLQDILGMNDKLKRENPEEERINNPANPNNYWQYRMHILLEDLLTEKEFNEELKGYVENSGRGD